MHTKSPHVAPTAVDRDIAGRTGRFGSKRPIQYVSVSVAPDSTKRTSASSRTNARMARCVRAST